MKDTVDIEKVYDSYSHRLYNISLRITGSSGDAEEIMHDTLLQYWKFRQKEQIRDLSKWLTSICIRKSIDRLRDKSRWNEFLEGYEDPALEESPSDDGEYNASQILKALAGLPGHYRAILSLHLFEGFDYQEIAQITGAKENTIRSLYMRGRKLLAQAIKTTGYERN
ncbi:MAG: sigma-70 family RNA polymerase sigma factor [Bacteroidales bacterium]|nr:sigma-70 family RNA polymerase sigma factor [Bacteroidales bacterium]